MSRRVLTNWLSRDNVELLVQRAFITLGDVLDAADTALLVSAKRSRKTNEESYSCYAHNQKNDENRIHDSPFPVFSHSRD